MRFRLMLGSKTQQCSWQEEGSGIKTASLAVLKQRGAVVITTAIAMLAIIAVSGLALDMGHAYVNKTRLQNAVDAAALNAAKVLDDTDDTGLATAAALTMFTLNANGAGNAELGSELGAGNVTVVTQFSDTLYPFVPGGANPDYVQVSVNSFVLQSWFIRVLGFNTKTVAASAVAGPSPTLVQEACDVAPMMVCGTPDANPGDGEFYGYDYGELQVLKTGSTGGSFEVGPGNFQLIRLGGGQGGANVRRNAAGDYAGCVSSDGTIPTEPGNTVGPVFQGINCRFGACGGPLSGQQAAYPPDVIVTEAVPPLDYDPVTGDVLDKLTGLPITAADMTWDYAAYQADSSGPPYDFTPVEYGGIGVYDRRVLTVPIGDCSTATNGQGDIPLYGFGCFFLLQQAVQQGNDAELYGQFVGDCGAQGYPGQNPGAGPGPYIIQLYEDTSTLDS
ncbi:MAG: TadE/TadG family type IV pilus assembly protein [Acidiferrobacterales bacterium]